MVTLVVVVAVRCATAERVHQYAVDVAVIVVRLAMILVCVLASRKNVQQILWIQMRFLEVRNIREQGPYILSLSLL